jgi:hypothetical protein
LTPEERQAVLDEEHLRLLSLFHYISGGITVVFSLLFGLWTAFVSTMFASFPPIRQSSAEAAVPPQLQYRPETMFAVFGIFCAMGIAYGILEIVAGRFISQRRGRVFILIAALPRVMFISYGAILTIFTLLVLDRPSVRQLYRRETGL